MLTPTTTPSPENPIATLSPPTAPQQQPLNWALLEPPALSSAPVPSATSQSSYGIWGNRLTPKWSGLGWGSPEEVPDPGWGPGPLLGGALRAEEAESRGRRWGRRAFSGGGCPRAALEVCVWHCFFCHPERRGRAGLWTQVCSRARAPKPVPVTRSRCPGTACSVAAPGGPVPFLASEASLGSWTLSQGQWEQEGPPTRGTQPGLL